MHVERFLVIFCVVRNVYQIAIYEVNQRKRHIIIIRNSNNIVDTDNA